MPTPNFKQRSPQKELIDTDQLSFDEFHDCLIDLAKVNAWTLAYAPTLNWLTNRTRRKRFPEPVSVLDVGSGGGDMLRKIGLWAKKERMQVNLLGVDINPWAKKSAELISQPDVEIEYKTQDIFALDTGRQFDFIVSSLFTHHLSNDELMRFISWMDKRAKRGWFINDLHRHAIPYHFIKNTVDLLSSNRLIIHDAPISVSRAFTRQDWRLLLDRTGISQAHVRIAWHFPFRYSVSCVK